MTVNTLLLHISVQCIHNRNTESALLPYSGSKVTSSSLGALEYFTTCKLWSLYFPFADAVSEKNKSVRSGRRVVEYKMLFWLGYS
jgi:hypothetical protein